MAVTRPSFQFYPGDWLRNTNLRRCSPAARGVWVDVLCLMHDSDTYGALTWPLAEIARAVGATKAQMRELVDKGVLKGCDAGVCEPFVYVPRSGRKDGEPITLIAEQQGPIWYSSRMVRDEYVRTIRGESTRFPAAPDTPPKATPKATPKPSPKPPFGERHGEVKGDGSSSSSATALNTKGCATTAIARAEGPSVKPLVQAKPPPNPPPGGHPTPAGRVCRLMRDAGLVDTNPGHPKLLALLDAGASDAEFCGAAQAAVERGKGFAYALAALDGQRRDAASAAPPGTRRPTAAAPPSETAYQRSMRLRAAEIHPDLAAKPPGAASAYTDVIEAHEPAYTAPRLVG